MVKDQYKEIEDNPIYKAICNVILKHFVSPINVSPIFVSATVSKLVL